MLSCGLTRGILCRHSERRSERDQPRGAFGDVSKPNPDRMGLHIQDEHVRLLVTKDNLSPSVPKASLEALVSYFRSLSWHPYLVVGNRF